jgi:hypothetical protein
MSVHPAYIRPKKAYIPKVRIFTSAYRDVRDGHPVHPPPGGGHPGCPGGCPSWLKPGSHGLGRHLFLYHPPHCDLALAKYVS